MRLLILLLFTVLGFAQQGTIFEVARSGDIARLKPMLSDRALINMRGAGGRTPLHEAAAACQPEAARLLAEAGAILLAMDSQRQTAEMLGTRCADKAIRAQMARYLHPQPASTPRASDPWALQYAVARGQGSIVSMLLTLNVDVNAVDDNGDRALDIACLRGDTAIVRVLLSRGADPRLINKTGATPLHDAALKGSRDIIDLLLARGADVNAPDRDSGSTPLHYAASFGRLDAARALLASGAQVNRKDSKGGTPLAVAEKNGHTELAMLLKAQGGK